MSFGSAIVSDRAKKAVNADNSRARDSRSSAVVHNARGPGKACKDPTVCRRLEAPIQCKPPLTLAHREAVEVPAGVTKQRKDNCQSGEERDDGRAQEANNDRTPDQHHHRISNEDSQ